jgi:hypothetical protein
LEALEINAPTEASEVLEGQVYTGVVEPGTAAVTSDFVHHLHAFSNLVCISISLGLGQPLYFHIYFLGCKLWFTSFDSSS